MSDAIQNDGSSRSERQESSLMSATIARVAENSRPGSNAHSGWLASVRAGITMSGEVRAIAAAGKYVSGLPPRHRSAALRAAAIRAINKDVAHSAPKGYRLGHALARLGQAPNESKDSIRQQIAALPMMPMDAAALVIDGLVGRCGRRGITVNFYDLADVLMYWGDGASGRSQARRTKVILDFYTDFAA